MPLTSRVSPLSHGFGDAVGEHLSDEERAFVYRWLAGLFARELSLEALTTYRTQDGAALLRQLERLPALAGLVRELSSRTEGEGSLGPVAGELAGAFARLFLSVGGRRSAPPYESAYTSERGLLFQEAVDHMGESLADLALGVPRDFPEPPDHIAVQLSVMAELAGRCEGLAVGEELETLVRKQRSFLEARLIPWVPRFRDDCAAFDRSGFYATVAGALVEFVTSDAAWLREGSG